MPYYGAASSTHLATCTRNIKLVFTEVIKRFDNTIREGIRSLTRQAQLVSEGASKTMNSKHLPSPLNGKSRALDTYPYPVTIPKLVIVDGMVTEANARKYAKDLARYYYFGGYVLGTADAMGIPIRWGGDWDSDREVNDQKFDDLIHFEEKGEF